MRSIDRAIDHHCRRASGESHFDELVPVHRFALQGKEQIARNNIAAVDFYAGDLKFAHCDPASGTGNGNRIPQRQSQQVRRIGRPGHDLG